MSGRYDRGNNMGRRTIQFLLLLTPAIVSAQQAPTLPQPRSRTELVDFLKAGDALQQAGSREMAAAILSGKLQVSGLPPDTVARALVDVAASDARRTARTQAMAVLMYVGRPGASGRYAAAFERFAEIFQLSTDGAIRGTALANMVDVGQPDRVLRFLKPIATNTDPRFSGFQANAIGGIARLNSNESVAFLRELHKSGTVTDEWPARALDRLSTTGYRVPQSPR
jgi:hypothetical protein